MTPKLRRIYKQAKRHVVFCEHMKRADGCHVPHFMSDDAEKIAFAGMFLGWQLFIKGANGYNQWYAEV